MKWIKYIGSIGRKNIGTEENPVWEDILRPMSMLYCESNEEIAKCEAYKGEYTIEDDGQPEAQTPEERISELEEAFEMLLNGVTE